jgi:hypothetical protein
MESVENDVEGERNASIDGRKSFLSRNEEFY